MLGLVLIGAPWSLRDRVAGAAFVEAVFSLSDPVDPAFVRDLTDIAAFVERLTW